jgi:cytoskeletal protein CcmA (bactofilin family)
MADEQKPQDAAGSAANGQAPPAPTQSAPQDALEKTNDELGEAAASETPAPTAGGKPAKQPSGLKKFLKRFNLYLLLFALVVVIGIAVTAVAYLNSKKAPKEPTIATKALTQDDLKQLANSDATVGDTGQTLTVQGNAVFSGQVLVRSNLNVAGTIQLASSFTVPELIVSNTANLPATQVSSLQVSQGSTFQGQVTVQNGLNVGGSTAFSGPVTAGQITVTKLIMSGNASLEVPNHLNFTGASPGRTISPSVLGVGGSASINGSDVTGTININTGSGPAAGCFMNVTFNRPFANTPHVLISPVGSAAGQTSYYVDRSTTGFSLCTNNAAPANQVFAFDYFITGT